MRFSMISAVAMASAVSAHTTMFGVSVNGADQGDGRNSYIRSPPNNSPVKDVKSPDLVCNVNGGTAVANFVKAAAGDTLTFEWFHDNRNDDIIDGSHKGPVITYIAAFTEGNPAGPVWTKIAEDGLSGGVWAVDRLKSNGGKNDFTLPSGLAAGQYIVRQEIIALHEAETNFDENAARGAQFYPSCVQLEITSGGSATPSENFDVNSYSATDPGILFNIYNNPTEYPIPGPQVSSLEGGSEPAPAPAPAPAPETPAPQPTNPDCDGSAPRFVRRETNTVRRSFRTSPRPARRFVGARA